MSDVETPDVSTGALSYEELMTRTIGDLGEYWSATMPEIYPGLTYAPVERLHPYRVSTGDMPVCGEPEPDPTVFSDNAFYCVLDDYIAWDAEGLFPRLFNEFGDFTVSLVLAHEWGHAIQQRAGVLGPSILMELQADCFAGAWAGSLEDRESEVLRLSPGDLDEAIGGYLQFRDPPGTDIAHPGAHGSGFDRVNAFADGHALGAEQCIDYMENYPLIVPLPFTEEDFASGGNMPYEDIAPVILTDLDLYWSGAMRALYVRDWKPLVAAIPYDMSRPETLPPCGGVAPDPAKYAATIFYCKADDFIAWDDAYMRGLYDTYGDFAVGAAIAHEFAHAVQVRATISTQVRFELEQHADCLTGAWVASTVYENGLLRLTAGDLDEAIGGFLAQHDPTDSSGGAATYGTAFQRVAAFQEGITEGAVICTGYAR